MPHAEEPASETSTSLITKPRSPLILVDPSHVPALEALEALRRSGNLKVSAAHPSLPLKIYNYTDKAQYRSEWNKDLLTSRGLVVNTLTGEVVARPLTKFFSWGDRRAKQAIETAERGTTTRDGEDTQPSTNFNSTTDPNVDSNACPTPPNAPSTHTTQRTVYEKLDGSMILWFFHRPTSQWLCTSRGSFTSPHAVSAEKLARSMRLDAPGRCDPACTYMFELLDRTLKVKLDYGPVARIVLLAVIDTKTGVERALEDEARRVGIECVREVADTRHVAMEELAKSDVRGQEGYVVRWPDGTRVKVKFASYLGKGRGKDAGKALTRLVVKRLCSGDDLERILNGVQDERYAEVKEIMDLWESRVKGYKKRLRQVLEDCKDMDSEHVPRALEKREDTCCDCCTKEDGKPTLCPDIDAKIVRRILKRIRKTGACTEDRDKFISEMSRESFSQKI